MTRFFQGLYYDNLGIAYDGGTGVFSIQGADGRALSSLNPAIVVLRSKSTPGEFIKYQVTANQDFIDDAGASQIINNGFGFTLSSAITDDVPFFIYAVSNDNEDTIKFMIGRIPGLFESPTSARIGVPGTPGSNTPLAMFSIDSITTTDYDQNPCNCIGSFRMKMSSSGDWTVQTLIKTEGIGNYQEGIVFTVPLGQFGGNSGAWTFNFGGTAPVFSNLSRNAYWFSGNVPKVHWTVQMSGDGGTDGSGADFLYILAPFQSKNSDNQGQFLGFVGIPSGTATVRLVVNSSSSIASMYRYNATGGLDVIRVSEFVNGNRTVEFDTEYLIISANPV